MCHDFDPRSYFRGHGHSAHTPKTVSGPSVITAKLDLDNISCNRIMTLTQGHIAKVKVIVYTWQFFPRPLPFMVPLDGNDTSHNCCP